MRIGSQLIRQKKLEVNKFDTFDKLKFQLLFCIRSMLRIEGEKELDISFNSYKNIILVV